MTEQPVVQPERGLITHSQIKTQAAETPDQLYRRQRPRGLSSGLGVLGSGPSRASLALTPIVQVAALVGMWRVSDWRSNSQLSCLPRTASAY